MLRFVVYDDRNPDRCLHTQKCYSKEDGLQEGRDYIRMMYQDPDDGVVPVHLSVRVETAWYKTTVYDDAFPTVSLAEHLCEKDLQAVTEAKHTVENLKRGDIRAIGRYTFRLQTEWRKC